MHVKGAFVDKSIVFFNKGDFFCSTWDLSIGFKMQHKYLKSLIHKFRQHFDLIGFMGEIHPRMTNKKGGQIEEYWLNEEQAMFLCTLCSNNEEILKFKRLLVSQFLQQKRMLLAASIHAKNSEWLEKRATGKIERRLETDIIKKFVIYATERGSTNAHNYYMIISKMENTALFAFNYISQKFPNLRECVNTRSLDALMMADRIVGRALEEGMENLMDYKEIYKLARDRVIIFGQSIGKTPLDLALEPSKLLVSSQ